MGIDALSSVAPARVRCLLLPFGRITQSSFTAFARRLKEVSIVRLGDISPAKAPDSGVFSPLSFPNGSVVFDFAESSPLSSHRTLLPFEMYREHFVVLALSNGREYDQVAQQSPESELFHQAVGEFSECVMSLQDNYPNALVHRLVLVDFDTAGIKLPSGTVTIPSVERASATALRTMMSDITSALLEELSALASSIRGLPNVETPKAIAQSGSDNEKDTRRSSRPASTLSMAPEPGKVSPTPENLKVQHRASMPPHQSTPELSLSNGQRPLSGIGTPPASSDEIPSTSSRPAGPFVEMPNSSGERISMQGFGSGTAGERARNQAQSRVGIVIGSLCLLAGKWADATKELNNGATSAKANSDYAWHAKALDLLLVALLMQAWAKIEFEIPSILHPYSDRNFLNRSRRSKSLTANGERQDSGMESQSNEANLVALQELSTVIPELSNNILHLYTRAAEFNSTRVPQVVYSETVVRHARILQLIRASGGSLTPPDLQHVIEGSQKPAAVPSHFIGEHSNSPSRMDVANFVYRAMPQSGSAEFVETSDTLRIFAGIASVLSDLNFQRKKGLVLRELVATLLPALVQSRKDSAAELGLHPAASFEAGSSAPDTVLGQTQNIGIGIRAFLILLCEIYGITQSQPGDSDQEKSSEGYESGETIAKRAMASAVRRLYGNPLLKIDTLRSCINVCEALPDLIGLLQFSSNLLSTAGSGVAPGPSTIDSAPSLSIDDQVRLATNIYRAASAAKQSGIEDAEADYWDDFLVRDIGLSASGSTSNTPVLRRKTELDLAKAATTVETKDGPFIFNPFAAKPTTTSKDVLLVVNEETTFVLLLQNLYDMDLEIEWIKFDNESISMDALVKDLVIGPYRTQNVQIPCTPRGAGKLSLLGCIAKIKGCRPRRFPLFRKPWRLRDPLKLKRHGLSAAVADVEQSPQDMPEGSKTTKQLLSELPALATFEALVIQAQPTLILKSTSLPQSALMILDGETRTFTVTLRNTSDTPIDLFLVSLEDSTSLNLQHSVADKDLSPAQLYELEFSAQSRPALRVLPHPQGEDISIGPKEDLTLEIEVFGKIGLTHGTIVVEYSHLGVPRAEIEEKFFTRRLTVPFEVTVNSSLGLLYNDILPLTPESKTLSPAEIGLGQDESEVPDTSQYFYDILNLWRSRSNDLDYCLLMMDFNNAWSSPISFTLQLRDPTEGNGPITPVRKPYTLTTLVQPSRTSRVIVPFPKLLLENPYAPVPSLDPRHKRQYVVSEAGKARPEIERESREIFWYREEALKLLQAFWVVQSRSEARGEHASHQGHVDLRRLSMTPRMLESLRQDDLVIGLNMISPGATSDVAIEQAQSGSIARSIELRAGDFATLEVSLQSRVSYSVQPLLRLQPALRNQPYHIALDLGRKVAVNGILQKALPILTPGQVHCIRTGLAFLAPGEYELAALVEEVRILPNDEITSPTMKSRRRSEAMDLELVNVGRRSERRAWYCRQPCLVNVIEARHSGFE